MIESRWVKQNEVCLTLKREDTLPSFNKFDKGIVSFLKFAALVTKKGIFDTLVLL